IAPACAARTDDAPRGSCARSDTARILCTGQMTRRCIRFRRHSAHSTGGVSGARRSVMPVVLHVAQPTDAGVARCVADLAAHQVAKGWAVTVACPSAGPLRNWVRQSGALHMPWEAERAPSFDTVKEARGVSTAVRVQWPDVVHLHSSKAG